MDAKTNPLTVGARVAMLGDSYTEHGWWHLEVQHTLHLCAPQQKIKVFGIGIGGDTMKGAAARLKWDVSPLQPTHLFVLLGTNDSQYGRYLRGKDHADVIADRAEVYHVYEQSLRSIVTDAKRSRWIPMLGTPVPLVNNPLSEHDEAAINEVFIGFADIVRRVAREEGLCCIDLNTRMQAVYDRWQGNACDELFSADHVHPSQLCYRLIGRAWLAELGYPVVLPHSTAEADTAFEPFTQYELTRYDLEQLLRHCAFIRNSTEFHHKEMELEPDQIRYWLERYDASDCPQWLRGSIRDWMCWHNHMDTLFRRLECVQQAMVE